MSNWSGDCSLSGASRFESHGIAEAPQLLDRSFLALFGVRLVKKSAPGSVNVVQVCNMFQTAMSIACSAATTALIGPRRVAIRRYLAE